MHNPLLQDLETNFFGISHHNQNKKKYDFKNQRSQKIAQFLLHSQLNYEISELLIQELLEGKRKIRLKDSTEEISIASNFSIQDLKQKNLLWILDGKIQVPYSYENEDNPELEQTIQNLADIIYSKGKYEPSKLQISKTNASQISKQTPKFLKNGGKDHFEFDLKYEEIESVGSELWKLLLSNQTLEKNQKIKKWFTLMSSAFNYDDLFCLSFETQEAERLFIEASIEYINAQSILKQSWDELYFALLAYNSQHHHYEISNRVPEKLTKLNPQDSVWDAFLWWNSREIEFIANSFSGHYTHWLYFVLKRLDQLQSINLFEYMQSLLNKPFLTHILFAPFGSSLFPIFLKEEKMANIGLMILGSSIRQKYFPKSDYSLHRYETQRCELFWREGFEIYFSHLDKTMDKQWAGENLAQILLYMSDHFLFNPYLFRFSLDVIAPLKNQNKTLVLEKIFDETVSCLIESYETKANTQYPANYFSLLLWFLGQSLRFNSDTIEATTAYIINHLTSIYNQCYQELNLSVFSEIASDEWKFFLQLATQEQKEALLKKDIQQIMHIDESKLFYVFDTARTHLKVLLNLFQCNLDGSRDNITQDIIDFCKGTMRIDQQKINLFYPMIWSEDNLAKQLIEKINFFTQVQQKDFIEFLLEHFSLTNLMLLAQGLINNKNQEIVLQKLEQYQIKSEQDFQTMTQIITSVITSINTPNLHNFVDRLFKIWENTQNRHFDKQLKELKYKNEIKKIYESNIFIQDKIQQIEKEKIPIDKTTDPDLYRNVQAYKALLLTDLRTENDPKITYQNLKEIAKIYDKQKEYAFYIFKAHIAMIDQETCEKQSVRYEKAIMELADSKKELTVEELLTVLDTCIKANNGDLFNQYWKKVPPLYISFDERFKQIKPRFKQEANDIHPNKQPLQLEDYRNYWSYIKSASLESQIEIFCESDIVNKYQNNKKQMFQYFIKKVIIKICTTMLNRIDNLKITKIKKKTKKKELDKEDKINDWFVSLLKHQFDFIQWVIKDQFRAGVSATKQSSGEIDFDISHPSEERVCLAEAFKLKNCSTSVIKRHYNKISGYDSVGCKIIVFLIYVESRNFSALVGRYCDHIKKNDYSGYQRKSNHEIIEVETNFANIKLFKETRLRNEAEITFLHFLLDFGVE